MAEVPRGGQGLGVQLDVLVAGDACRRRQALGGRRLRFVVLREARRAPQNHTAYVRARVPIGAGAHLAEEHADQIFDAHQRAMDACAPEADVRQVLLHGAEQPTVGAGTRILADGVGTEGPAVVRGEEEHALQHARGVAVGGQLGELTRAVCPNHGQERVAGAEIYGVEHGVGHAWIQRFADPIYNLPQMR